MWYHNENGDTIKPLSLDNTSSKQYVYVRKNFILIEAHEDSAAHWSWDEIKIPKADWAIYESVMNHEAALEDVYAALAELAELMTGE